MKGDFSRFTFDPQKRYSSVRMQQGRVQLDADWNEQIDITEHRIETEITDFIGQSGAPENNAGFEISIIQNGKNLKISKGRYYIEGMLFENPADYAVFPNQPEATDKLELQPDLPETKLEDFIDQQKPNGIYLVYLDVWQRHITALEDPEIREVALGGADTTTRIKNVWQVKLHKVGEPETKVDEEFQKKLYPGWKPDWETEISTGQLQARINLSNSPVAILENQLYRVEIHKSGNSSEATFKWSRDNGASAAQVEAISDTIITVKNIGQSAQILFSFTQIVEISDETLILTGKPGYLARVKSVQDNTLEVEWLKGSKPSQLGKYPTLRRWDSASEIKIKDDWILLEKNIEIKFETDPNEFYKTGDYWLIPARNLKGNIEWHRDDKNNPIPQPPHGVLHRYSSLALLKWESTNSKFSVLADCRFRFKPLTTGLLSKAGDTMTGKLTINDNLSVRRLVTIGDELTETPKLGLNISYQDNNNFPQQIFLGGDKDDNPHIKLDGFKKYSYIDLNGRKISCSDKERFGLIVAKTDPEQDKDEIFKFIIKGDLDLEGTASAQVKSFKIKHPIKPGFFLVHACLEGSEIGVYYRGEAQLREGKAIIKLPDYFEALTRQEGRTVQLTAKGTEPYLLSYTNVVDGNLKVYGTKPNGEFSWEVKAIRADVEILDVEIAERE